MTEGKGNVNMGCIEKETKYIGPSLRAIKPGWGKTVQALAQDDKQREDRLEQTATVQLQKLTGSQDDKGGDSV